MRKGISLGGLGRLRKRIQQLCADGLFAEDCTINGRLFKGTTDYRQLTTTQLVYMWVGRSPGPLPCSFMVMSDHSYSQGAGWSLSGQAGAFRPQMLHHVLPPHPPLLRCPRLPDVDV